MPRIITGSKKGLKLDSLPGEHTRPTSDKVKGSLFSILQNQIYGKTFLDVFAGSGQMSIEAISRGAESAVVVESYKPSLHILKQNIKKCDFTDQIQVMPWDFALAIPKLKNQKFDFIFLDPPYQQALKFFHQIGKLLLETNILSSNSMVIVEHSSKDLFPENVINLTLYRRCKYGSTMLTFYIVQEQ